MAQERVQIRLDAVDNTKKAFNGLRGNTDKAKNALFNLRNAFISLGAGLALKGIVSAGIEIENLGVQLKALFGSAKAGQQALAKVTEFAKGTPFELQNIQQGITALATVRKQADKAGVSFEELLKITGNTATLLGGDFALASLQIQRSFSAGVNSAELFRERGITAMAGFKNGVRANVDQSIAGLRKAFGTGGEFGNLTEELSKTLGGTLSNLKDAFYFFQVSISKGFFGELKKQLQDLQKTTEEANKEIAKFGTDIGEGLAVAISALAEGFKYLKENINTTEMALGIFIATFSTSILGKIAGAFIAINAGINELNTQTRKGIRTAIDYISTIGDLPFQEIKIFTDSFTKQVEVLDNLIKGTKAYDEELYRIIHTEYERKLALEKTRYEQEQLNEAVKAYKEAYEASFTGQLTIQAQASLDKMKLTFKEINELIVGSILKGIDTMSVALAESIILGKDLGNAFKQFILSGIVSAVAGLIKYYMTKLLIWVLEKLFPNLIKNQIDLEQSKLNILKKQTAELRKQMVIKAIMRFAFGFAEGGAVKGNKAEGGGVQGYRQSGGQTSRTNAYIVGERGRELFVPSTDGTIIPNHEMGGIGSTNINFTVQATDVKGVQELLIDNRATITNIINTALNQRGKPALI